MSCSNNDIQQDKGSSAFIGKAFSREFPFLSMIYTSKIGSVD